MGLQAVDQEEAGAVSILVRELLDPTDRVDEGLSGAAPEGKNDRLAAEARQLDLVPVHSHKLQVRNAGSSVDGRVIWFGVGLWPF